MRIPSAPPSFHKVLEMVRQKEDPDKLLQLFTQFAPTDYKDRYLHWDELRYRDPPAGFTIEEHWFGTKFARSKLLKSLPFFDIEQRPFQFGMPDCVLRMLHEIDQNASGRIRMAEPITNASTRDSYLINSLIEEAINSSQLEGAATTRKVAKEMIRTKRPPRNRSEQMIFNNFQAMQFVQEYQKERLTPAMIYELHRIVTDKTLDDPTAAGRLRGEDDDIQIIDNQGNLLFVPPSADELPERLRRLCKFANEKDSNSFIHPVIRAILLHFMLAYDHPFVDGNGRTARALFYWQMAREKYWLIEFTSISQIIKMAPAQYARAFLYTETDDNDVTYFIIHQLRVIQRAIEQLHTYLARKTQELKSATQLLVKTKLEGVLNHRQLALLENALKEPNAIYRIREHQNVHGVAYQTARTDLLMMADELNLLHKVKDGKTFIFLSPPDLRQRLDDTK